MLKQLSESLLTRLKKIRARTWPAMASLWSQACWSSGLQSQQLLKRCCAPSHATDTLCPPHVMMQAGSWEQHPLELALFPVYGSAQACCRAAWALAKDQDTLWTVRLHCKRQRFSNTSYTAIFESNSATCLCNHCSFLQQRNDKVVDSVKKHAHHPMSAYLSNVDSTGCSFYICETTSTHTSFAALEIVNVVCRLKLRDKGLG